MDWRGQERERGRAPEIHPAKLAPHYSVLAAQLQRRSPQLTKELDEPLDHLLEEVQIHEMSGWHVLTFAPRIPLPAAQTP